MLPRNKNDLVRALRALVENRVGEGRQFDFKEELPGPKDDDKREFLADVSSFANSYGGDIVFGVKEERDSEGKRTGYPEAILGLDGNVEDAKLRLESLVRDGLDPRPATVEFDVIPDDGFPRGPVLVARIGRSWGAPHMVTFKGLSRFHARTGTGKHQMDVHEIRSAFLRTHDLLARVRGFHAQRLQLIVSGGAPIDLGRPGGPFIAVHVVPLLTDPLATRDVAPASERLAFRGLLVSCDRSRWNLDGRLYYAEYKEGSPVPGYTQVFRDGSIETVDTYALAEGSQLHAQAIEIEVVKALEQNLRKVRLLEVHEPLVVMIALHGVRGFGIVGQNAYWGLGAKPPTVDRDDVALPECMIEGEFRPEQLKSTFDALWQSGGWSRSPSFDDEGRWKNPR